MVISSIIHNLGYPIIVLHIDYGNREESAEEGEFIKYYCQQHRIDSIYHEMDIFRVQLVIVVIMNSPLKKQDLVSTKKLIETENVAGIALSS